MTTTRKLVSLVSPCFNEQDNVEELYRRACGVMAQLPQYDFEYVIIDNASTDRTVEKLKAIAARDPRVRIIVNMRNFGHLRSPYWGIIQTRGDVTVYFASDLQDPPELIPQFLAAWEEGFKIVLAVKPVSQTNPLVHWLRKAYYRLLDRISEVALVKDATGFGLYDRAVLDLVRQINDPYPFLRGLICELGFPIKTIAFSQPRRQRGITKNNFYTLYDMAMLGIVSHSVVPIRLAAMFGFVTGFLSILVALVFLVLKLTLWSRFPVGVAPIVIGMFFMFGVVLLFIGILGEYIASIHNYVRNRPVVVERERVNFDRSPDLAVLSKEP
jgi:glycosyltransferase involved in cell wall biosynthesis